MGGNLRFVHVRPTQECIPAARDGTTLENDLTGQ